LLWAKVLRVRLDGNTLNDGLIARDVSLYKLETIAHFSLMTEDFNAFVVHHWWQLQFNALTVAITRADLKFGGHRLVIG
jgi:hypothetical protein